MSGLIRAKNHVNTFRTLSELEICHVSGGGGALEGIPVGEIVVTGNRLTDLGFGSIGDWLGGLGIGHVGLSDHGDGTLTGTTDNSHATPTPTPGSGADRSFSGTGNVVVPLDITVIATFDYDKDGNTDAFMTPSGDIWAYDVHTGNVLGTVKEITVTANHTNGADSSLSGSVIGTMSITPSFGGSTEGKGTVSHSGTNGASWTINPQADQSRLYQGYPGFDKYNNK